MILVFGGAYQGKLAYAMGRFELAEEDVFRCSDTDAAIPGDKKLIYELDKWLLALVKAEADAADALERFIDSRKDAVVICNDISCGVVPVDGTLRKWRETVGRALAELSSISDETIRLFCGIPSRIK